MSNQELLSIDDQALANIMNKRHRSAKSQFKNPPQPKFCIKERTVDGREIYINILSYSRIAAQLSEFDPVRRVTASRASRSKLTWHLQRTQNANFPPKMSEAISISHCSPMIFLFLVPLDSFIWRNGDSIVRIIQERCPQQTAPAAALDIRCNGLAGGAQEDGSKLCGHSGTNEFSRISECTLVQ